MILKIYFISSTEKGDSWDEGQPSAKVNKAVHIWNFSMHCALLSFLYWQRKARNALHFIQVSLHSFDLYLWLSWTLFRSCSICLMYFLFLSFHCCWSSSSSSSEEEESTNFLILFLVTLGVKTRCVTKRDILVLPNSFFSLIVCSNDKSQIHSLWFWMNELYLFKGYK